MAPLCTLLTVTCFACSWDSHTGVEFVARTTMLLLLLGWPLAPSLLRLLRRWLPSKSAAKGVAVGSIATVAAGGARFRTLVSFCWAALARPVAYRLDRVLRTVPNGLAGIPTPGWRLKLTLLVAAVGTALPLALSMALGVAALLRLTELVGRLAALIIVLGWPLGPSLYAFFNASAIHQPGRLGRCRRRLFCHRAPRVLPTESDDCPICCEPLLQRAARDGTPLTADGPSLDFCQWGCGRSVHSACMRTWMASTSHGTASDALACCLCRAQWR